jgi:hypothetical protein
VNNRGVPAKMLPDSRLAGGKFCLFSMEGGKEMKKLFKGILLLAIIGCFACGCFAQEIAGTTEITGYYQQYRNFSFETGMKDLGYDWDLNPARLGGGGFSIAQNIADWFAIWTQFTFYGTSTQGEINYSQYLYPKSVRVIHNLQGIRYQTLQYGPFQLYGKAGAGFVNYSLFDGLLGGTKFTAGYGGGVHVWLHKNIGITLDASHSVNALPNLEDYFDVKLPGREKFDSGMIYTTGLTFRF